MAAANVGRGNKELSYVTQQLCQLLFVVSPLFLLTWSADANQLERSHPKSPVGGEHAKQGTFENFSMCSERACKVRKSPERRMLCGIVTGISTGKSRKSQAEGREGSVT